MKVILLILIRFYRRFISPLKPPSCRFYPTCSAYAMIAVERHGAMRGGFLALKRLLKCHPFNPGGYDPVPPRPCHDGANGPNTDMRLDCDCR